MLLMPASGPESGDKERGLMLIMRGKREAGRGVRVNVVNVLVYGPGAGLSTFPFHCWLMFRTSPDSHFRTLMRGDGPYTGARRHTCTSPVSLLVGVASMPE